jgi:hypothetical protein
VLDPWDRLGDGLGLRTFINRTSGATSARRNRPVSSWAGKIVTSISPAINASMALS